jgi:hypothetical protein
VHDDQQAGIEAEDEVLAAALDALDAGADDAFTKGRLIDALEHRDGLAGVGRDAHAGDAASDDAPFEVAAYSFYFGELRHLQPLSGS